MRTHVLLFRIAYGIGCSGLAADCIAMAIGASPQSVFGQNFIWMWWPAAAAWLLMAAKVLMEGVE